MGASVILVYPQRNTLLYGVPLGLAYIGAVLREAGHDVRVVDMRYEDEDQLFQVVEERTPDFVGFYSSSEIAPFVTDLSARIKAERPETSVVVGGPHATLDPAFFLDAGVDVVVRGEGEVTVVELVEVLVSNGDLNGIKGISFRSGDTDVDNPPREFIQDLDQLPFPAFDLFQNIQDTLWQSLAWTNLHPFTHIILSRGCPFQCSFCQPTLSDMFGKKVRRLSPTRSVELLEHLKERYGVREVFFEDDLLLSRIWKDWFFELTELMLERKLDLRWWGQARANSADREILAQAKRAGCYMVMCGVESGSQKTLDFYRKKITPDDVRGLFSMCRELGLMSVAEIIFGAPEETEEDAGETIELMEEVQPDMTWVCILTPYPGTHLTRWLSEHGIRYETDLSCIDRSIQRKKIDSPMDEKDLLAARARIQRAGVSPGKLLRQSHYRRAYANKMGNMLQTGNWPGAGKLAAWTVMAPLTDPLRRMYWRNPNHGFFKPLRAVYRRLSPQ